MADNKELDEAANKLLEAAEKQGIVIGKVKDGHIMIFTKAHLLGLLGKVEASGTDRCVLFVKDRTEMN